VALDQYNEEEESGGMSFLDHLEALRWHVVRSAAAILIFTIIAFLAKSIVFGIIAMGLFLALAAVTWSYRDVANRHEHKNSSSQGH
jgi:small-conductance mechanosensitive channel